MNALSNLKKMRRELDEKIRNEGKDILREAFHEFFHDNPDVKAVRWTQYTPYYSDGDPCTFSVGEAQFRIAQLDSVIPGEDVGGDEDADGEGYISSDYALRQLEEGPEEWREIPPDPNSPYGYYGSRRGEYVKVRDATPEEKEIAKAARKVFKACTEFWDETMDSDLFEAVFGDHVKVTATRRGFKIEEYDHS